MKVNDLRVFIDEMLINPESIISIEDVLGKLSFINEELVRTFLQASPQEMDEMNREMEEISLQLDSKFSLLAERMGMSREELDLAMQSPENFSSESWNSVSIFQKNLESDKNTIINSISAGRDPVKSEKRIINSKVYA